MADMVDNNKYQVKYPKTKSRVSSVKCEKRGGLAEFSLGFIDDYPGDTDKRDGSTPRESPLIKIGVWI
jgi:hypothetical protein